MLLTQLGGSGTRGGLAGGVELRGGGQPPGVSILDQAQIVFAVPESPELDLIFLVELPDPEPCPDHVGRESSANHAEIFFTRGQRNPGGFAGIGKASPQIDFIRGGRGITVLGILYRPGHAELAQRHFRLARGAADHNRRPHRSARSARPSPEIENRSDCGMERGAVPEGRGYHRVETGVA